VNGQKENLSDVIFATLKKYEDKFYEFVGEDLPYVTLQCTWVSCGVSRRDIPCCLDAWLEGNTDLCIIFFTSQNHWTWSSGLNTTVLGFKYGSLRMTATGRKHLWCLVALLNYASKSKKPVNFVQKNHSREPTSHIWLYMHSSRCLVSDSFELANCTTWQIKLHKALHCNRLSQLWQFQQIMQDLSNYWKIYSMQSMNFHFLQISSCDLTGYLAFTDWLDMHMFEFWICCTTCFSKPSLT